MVKPERHRGAEISRECRYCISSLARDALPLAEAVRSRWAIKNQPQGMLDVNFREDDSRIRRNHAPTTFNALRPFALNLLKRQPIPRSVKPKRFTAALDHGFPAKVVFQQ